MNSGNSKTSYPCKLLLNFTDKIDLKKDKKVLSYQVLALTICGKT